MLDLWLIMTVGFLGSFGHCGGMCGPLTVAFSLSGAKTPTWYEQLYFHSLLNLGRLLSYTLVGAAIGGLGSVLVASGQLAGISSGLRQVIAIITGLMLIWFGLVQIMPNSLPRLPFLNPILVGNLHQRLNAGMVKLSMQSHWWTPVLLGGIWGFIPCGFLYAAQIKAAETGNIWIGAATMFAFGLGTLPTMLGVGIFTSKVSADKRSQLFRIGGWVTLCIGIITLLRTGEMVDLTGHAALILLILALVARPLCKLSPQLLRYRRALGVGAFVLAIAHTAHMLSMSFNWNLSSVLYMLPRHQWGMAAGILGLLLMTPAAVTSFDSFQKNLGKHWRTLHLASVPALILSAVHAVLIGSHYLGELHWAWPNKLVTVLMLGIVLCVLLVRMRWFWFVLSWEKFYVPPIKSK